MMRLLLATLLLTATSMGQAASADNNNPDPWEGFNRRVFAFNEVMDKYVLKPTAQAYQYVTPQDVDDSVSQFFSNIGDVLVVVNDIGQLKFGQAASDSGRFLINTTVGFFGFFDVATHIGLKKHNEDFGQTLGYWGVGTGPYLVLPFLGPSNLRDTGGLALTWSTSLGSSEVGATTTDDYSLIALQLVDLRADLISSESLITGDKYIFLRSFYLQRREYLVNDGVTADSFGDDFDDFDDEEWDDDWDEDWDKQEQPAAPTGDTYSM
ncbi:VacJ family lipoprotein [Candidatus Thalassolituus haligoni]|uniref:MlaA family lipoprotein n=1 Tax=Candidatus Thalassolituus haligoni TaxID=3100113 RepID=UPI0035160568|tara:strand:- start:4614 stop:5411 length:798 start_codon:yes stop_codon:yes gene_type:complete